MTNHCIIRIYLICLLFGMGTISHSEELLDADSKNRLKSLVIQLADRDFRGRAGQDAQRALRLLADKFEDLKLKSPENLNTKYLQPIKLNIPSKQSEQDQTEENDEVRLATYGHNLIGIVEGTDEKLKDEYIVIGAHVDHLGSVVGSIYYGADDNATGTSIMMELAKYFKQHPLKRSLIFVGFDLEERGLIGAKYFVKHSPIELSKIKLALIMDMVGREKGTLIEKSVFVIGSEYVADLREAINQHAKSTEVIPRYFSADFIGARSDYGPFWKEKIPFLFFTTGMTPEYHTPKDTIETIDFEKHAKVAEIVGHSLKSFGNADSLPVFSDEPAIDLEDIQTAHIAIDGILANEKLIPKDSFQRAIVKNVKASLGAMIDRNQFSKNERKWLVNIVRSLTGLPPIQY